MAKEKFNFTKAFEQVEEINDWFQQENIDLDEALEKYKKGITLLKKCKERLKQAENRFDEIKEETIGDK